MNAMRRLLGQYRDALREEPKARAFVLASSLDEVGVAVSTWASTLLLTSLFTDQRTRASLMLPTLACFLAGTLISGPLADWAQRESLARFRYQLVVWARLIETAMLGVLIAQLGTGPVTVAKVAPFMMLTAFTKTAFRPARAAFAVDLLRCEATQLDAAGRALLDEHGQPLAYKTHLLTFSSLIVVLSSAATLGGLLVGGHLMRLAGGAFTPLFVAQLVAQLGFVAAAALFCHPDKTARELRLRDLWFTDGVARAQGVGRSGLLTRVAQLVVSQREVLRFLAQPQQRNLLLLLAGGALVELVTESYDGRMIIKHILHGSDDSLRYAEIALALAGLAGAAAVPALTRSVGQLGRIFVLTMLLDGVVIALAGSAARAQVASAVVPFTAFLIVDHSLTLVSGSLRDLAQNSASSAAMRGRIHGTYALFVIIGDMLTQQVATLVSDSVGIPVMLMQVGSLQVAAVVGLAMLGGRGLWQLGLREQVKSALRTVSA